MGIVKIGDALHEDVRRASVVMCRSINAQAEFWMRVGMLAESNPSLSFNEIMKLQLAAVLAPQAEPMPIAAPSPRPGDRSSPAAHAAPEAA